MTSPLTCTCIPALAPALALSHIIILLRQVCPASPRAAQTARGEAPCVFTVPARCEAWGRPSRALVRPVASAGAARRHAGAADAGASARACHPPACPVSGVGGTPRERGGAWDGWGQGGKELRRVKLPMADLSPVFQAFIRSPFIGCGLFLPAQILRMLVGSDPARARFRPQVLGPERVPPG